MTGCKVRNKIVKKIAIDKSFFISEYTSNEFGDISMKKKQLTNVKKKLSRHFKVLSLTITLASLVER